MNERLYIIVRWLGPDAAIAALEASELTIPEILELDSDLNHTAPKKISRAEAIRAIVQMARQRMLMSPDELMQLPPDKLIAYFHDVRISRAELLEMLVNLDIRPGSAAKKNLFEFAAREISDIGMFRRVAMNEGRKQQS